MKNYTQAPLPFQGQKRRWNGAFKKALKEFDDCNVFIDLFGGSGLLARMAKDARQDAVVYYNDYDDYQRRIDSIPQTNALLSDLREILHGIPDGKLICEPHAPLFWNASRRKNRRDLSIISRYRVR